MAARDLSPHTSSSSEVLDRLRIAALTVNPLPFRGDEVARMTAKDLAVYLDASDPLRDVRGEFYFPVQQPHGSGETHTHADAPSPGKEEQEERCSLGGVHPRSYRYFCGNSLGLQHRDVGTAVQAELCKWRSQAVEGHFLQPNPWFEIDEILRVDMASLVGCKPSEVVIMNSLTANLHLLLSAFYRPEGRRVKLMSENFPFPSDTHAFVSQVRMHGRNPEEDYVCVADSLNAPEVISTESFLAAIERHGDETAVLVLGGVHFLTGQYFDIQAITEAAHAKGILVGVDAAHAAGNVPLQLHDWGVDFACWCSYKYLNGGPGNIAALFVHERHHTSGFNESGRPSSLRPLRGWWGHERSNRFSLHRDFDASVGAAAFQLSNPCVLSIMSLAPSVRLASRIGMTALRKKSLLLTGYLEYLIDQRLSNAVEVITPRDPNSRGCQLSIRLKPGSLKASTNTEREAYACGNNLNNDADLAQRLLLDRGVMCDNRPPDILRLAPVPTYNSFEDVWELVNTLVSLFGNGS